MSIELKNVSFSYEGSEKGALSDFNLSVKSGEFVVLAGESGCGKSTVTRLINAISPYFYRGELEGEVLIDGKNIKEIKRYELASIVGSVFQNPRTQFFNTHTDSEIAFGLENSGIDTNVINARMNEVYDNLCMEKLRDRDIFKLSGGEKQKVAFGSVYAMNPDIYVLDEPSSNLDEKGIEELKKCLKLVKEEGKTVVVAEHRLYYLAELADRFVYMKEGRILEVYSSDAFKALSEDKLKEMGLRAATFTPVYKNKENPSEEPKEATLHLNRICLKREGNVILSDLSLTFKKGRVYGIVGRNGVGKTTLLRTLSGLHKEYEGEITEKGVTMNPRQLKKRAYLVMQDVNYQLFGESVEKECKLGLKNVQNDKILKALKCTDLLNLRERHPNTLSGGQKQRLSVAVSMVYDKDIVLFDEPTSGLDGKNMNRIADIIKELASRGKYVVVVSHDYEFLNECCDCVVELV